MHDENVYAERAIRAGARGYIMKSEGGEKVLEAIRQVLRGEIYLSKRLSSTLLKSLSQPQTRRENANLNMLTSREFEVLELIGQGLGTCDAIKRAAAHQRQDGGNASDAHSRKAPVEGGVGAHRVRHSLGGGEPIGLNTSGSAFC